MLVIFAFFSIVSTVLVACFSVAVLNVVIRRESAYLFEERIKGIRDACSRLAPSLLEQVQGCQPPATNSRLFAEYPGAVWPQAQSLVTVAPKGSGVVDRPGWLQGDSFDGIVADRGRLEIRSWRTAERAACSVTLLVRVPLSQMLLQDIATGTGLQIYSTKPRLLNRHVTHEMVALVIEANFVPGSGRPESVVVVARNWQTGLFEDWNVCRLLPRYSRTVQDLSRMGMQTASWVWVLTAAGIIVAFIYLIGLLVSIRLSQRIVGVIDGLSLAALRVGKGDFSVSVAVPEQDQLGILVESFNRMTRDLAKLREQEKHTAVLERDISLAHEVQQYLYPRVACNLPRATVWGVTTPARVVSGDLYDFLPFSDKDVGLLCADVSGKGVSAALMMAHLQALAHGRLLPLHRTTRASPDIFATSLNRDLQGRFGANRYVTMFYGQFDSDSKKLRYVNAGHSPPILISETREPVKLTEGDPPIGLLPDIKYQELTLTLSKGSALLIYTDGVTDALNSNGEDFGEQRLLAWCKSVPKGLNARAMCDLLSRTITEWSDGVEQFDDITVLVLSSE